MLLEHVYPYIVRPLVGFEQISNLILGISQIVGTICVRYYMLFQRDLIRLAKVKCVVQALHKELTTRIEAHFACYYGGRGA